jgi:hypothetical protein
MASAIARVPGFAAEFDESGQIIYFFAHYDVRALSEMSG